MDLALLQMPMVLFTTLVPMASGAFVGLALAFLTSRFSKECLARIDRWTLLPMAILAVGYIASFVALSSPQYSMSLFQGVDIAPLSFVGIAGMLFIALAVVYWIIAMTGNLDERPRKVFATVVGAASLLLSLSIGAPRCSPGTLRSCRSASSGSASQAACRSACWSSLSRVGCPKRA